jgi:hypothetical protein
MRQTIAERLTALINKTLPKTIETGIVNHLMPKISIDPKSKGKAIVFTWQRKTFRLSDSHTVREQNFMNEWIETIESKAVQEKVKAIA